MFYNEVYTEYFTVSNEKDKDWLKNFLVDSSVPIDQVIEPKVNEINLELTHYPKKA